MTLEQLAELPIAELEEAVIFSEWRELRRASTRSLTRTAALMTALDYEPTQPPHQVIGVVGSKGKGTAAAYASAALAGLGYRVGTVMSPGAVSNADRIRIAGRVVEEPVRRRVLLQIESARRQLPPATAESGYLAPTGLFLLMGMMIFAQEGIDVAVAEAGIGGASDDLSHWPLKGVVVTGIFAEHLEILGPTVADVARDKASVVTSSTRFCVCFPQSAEVAQILIQRCSSREAVLLESGLWEYRMVEHLPAGFGRTNAALGVAAARAFHGVVGAEQEADLLAALRSVQYPGRLSLHRFGEQECVVDSAVSAAGLDAALDYCRQTWGHQDHQVLVCLPPSKDLAGFIQRLRQFPGRKVFVKIPGAYTGMPERDAWPWEWVTDDQLDSMLRQGHTLAAGTVLFTSLVLRTLKVDAERLFLA